MLSVKAFTFNPVQENTYLLYNEQHTAVLIDPGCYFDEERDQLLGFVTEKGLSVTNLLNTHCHLDHVFGNKWAYETWGKELQIHANEQVMLERAPASGLMWNLPFDNYNGPLQFFNGGDEIVMDNDRLLILEAPGHSPGHVCFYCKEQGFVIGGDVLFRGSIGRTDLPGGSYETLIHSIRTQLFTLPDETVVYSGHGQPTTIGYEKRNNPFFQ